MQADFAENEIVIAATKASIVRLEAELADRTDISFPEEVIAAAPEAVATEVGLFRQRALALQEQIAVLQQSVEALERSITEKTAEASIAETQTRIRKQEYDLLKPLVDAGHKPKLKLIDAETKWLQAQGSAELARLSASAMEAEKIGREKEIISIQSRTKAETSAQLVDANTSGPGASPAGISGRPCIAC